MRFSMVRCVRLLTWASVVWVLAPGVWAQTTLIPTGGTWRYHDLGQDLGTAWQAVSYDDTGWSFGPAQLGFGDGDEATVIGYGGNASDKNRCTYFRHTFSVTDVNGIGELTLLVRRDDGCVVYLNGTEVARSNLPAGTISYSTYASSAIGGSDESAWQAFMVNESLLVNGDNVVAVEMHQVNATSSDLSFDASLEAAAPPLPKPVVTLLSPADGTTINTLTTWLEAEAADELGLTSATLYLGEPGQTVDRTGPAELDDTQITADSPTSNSEGATSINVDGANPHAHAVLRFPSLFGTGAGQAPVGSLIESAILTLQCTNPGHTMQVNPIAEDWDPATTTWQERIAGVAWTTEGALPPGSALSTPMVEATLGGTGSRTIDLTPIVQAWSDGLPNYGIVVTDTGTDGIDFDTTESGNPPVLSVSYQGGAPDLFTQPLSDTAAGVQFEVLLEDQHDYLWNVLASNIVDQSNWAPLSYSLRVDSHLPDQPILIRPPDGSTEVALAPTLGVEASDPDGDALDVQFYARRQSAEDSFAIVVLPDTQKYSESYPHIFTAQTQWIANQVDALDIRFVCHVGDLVETWDNHTEWQRADASMSLLDGVVPYGILPGNHDQPTTYYNQYFPYTRYDWRPWYGGRHEVDTYDNNYQLISAGGMDLLFLNIEYCPSADVLMWAQSVLATYPDRKVILSTHGFLGETGEWSVHAGCGDTQYIWDALVVPYDNVHMVLCGHVHAEVLRVDEVNGRQVVQLLADYQADDNGGNGWLRIMRFFPGQNRVDVETYSPWLDQYQTDTDSQFSFTFPMDTFSLVGETAGTPSGQEATVIWPGLDTETTYDWFVEVTDPTDRTQISPLWSFTTGTGDSTPPAFPSIVVSGITEDQVVVDWNTDEETTGHVEFGLDTGYGSQVVSPASGLSHTVTLSSLLPSTTYHYQILATDGSGNTGVSGDLTFATADPNLPPVAADDAYAGAEDTPLTVAAPGLLTNDSDPDTDPLTTQWVSGPDHGLLTLLPDGEFTYTPEADFAGVDTFVYRAKDPDGASATASVTVTVTPVNDPPAALDDAYVLNEDESLSVPAPGLLANDSDPDMETLSAALGIDTTSGSLALNPDGSFSYAPAPGFYGSDSFTYTADDGELHSGEATVSLTILSINDAPIAADDAATTDEDTPIDINVLANDADDDGDTLQIVSVTQPAEGSASTDGSSISFAPPADESGDYTLTYTVGDGNGGSDTASVSITVDPVNDAPDAQDDVATTEEDNAVAIDVLANDTDAEGDALSILSVSAPAKGTAVINNGAILYTPEPDDAGVYAFDYTSGDASGATDTASITVTITPVNDPPVAADDGATTEEDTPINIDVLTNDTDTDGDTLQIVSVTQPAEGSASTDGSSISFAPPADESGDYTLTYTVSDDNGGSDTASVSITVDPVNDAPDAQDDVATTEEDNAVAIDVLANDTDAEGDALSILSVSAPAKGTAVINNGAILYTPEPDDAGVYAFDYTSGDASGATDTASITVTITPVNDPPVAADDEGLTTEDEAVLIDVLANDSDVETQPLTLDSVTQPVNGASATVGSQVSYTPAPGFNGTDSFTYTVSDGNGGLATAAVLITVLEVNDPPEAVSDSYAATEDQPLLVNNPAQGVLANDTDPEDQLVEASLLTGPVDGVLSLHPNGTFTYTPDPDFYGEDSFTYTVTDTLGEAATASVALDVQPVNDAPVAVDDAVTTAEDTAVAFDVLANDGDVDGDVLVIQSLTTPAQGTADYSEGTVTYTPAQDTSGTITLSYTIVDTATPAEIDTATITIHVYPVNDAPNATDDSAATDEDTTVLVDVLANDNDADNDTLTILGLTQPSMGAAALQGQAIAYTPSANTYGVDSFTYSVGDEGTPAETDSATVTITVRPVNDAPVTADENVSTLEDTVLEIDVLSNDSDPDADPLHIGDVTVAANGVVSIVADTLVYAPDLDFFGTDTFTYRADDPWGGSASADVTVTVTPVNDIPVAVADALTVTEDEAYDDGGASLLDNDTDADGDELDAVLVTDPAHGQLQLSTDGTFLYTPDLNYHGPDGFSYAAFDGADISPAATVTIDVASVNDPPLADGQSLVTPQGTPLAVTLTGSDVDVDPLTFLVESGPAYGALTGIVPDLVYTPNPGFAGLDAFTFQVDDGQTASAPATIQIDVQSSGPDIQTQQLVLTIPAGEASAYAAAPDDFTAVDGSRTILLLSGITQHAMGWEAAVNQDPFEISARAELTADDRIQVTRSSTVGQPTTVYLQLIEYTGPAGGPNEFVVRSRLSQSWASGTTAEQSAPVSTVLDPDKVVVFNTGTENSNVKKDQYDRGDIRAYLDANRIVQLSRRDGSGAIVSAHQVIEFTGRQWQIQSGDATPARHDPSSGPTAGGTDVTLADVGPIEHAWVYFNWDTSSANLDERGHRTWLVDSTTLRVQEHAAASGSKTVRWYVLTNPSLHVQTGADDDQFVNDVSTNLTGFTPVDDVSHSLVWVTGMTNGAGNAHPRDMWQFALTSPDTITLDRARSGQNLDYHYQVVEFRE